MNAILKKTALLFVMVMLLFVMLAVSYSEHVHAAEKYELPSKIVSYYYYEIGEKWVKDETKKFTYDKKGNVTKSGYIKQRNTYKKGKLRKIKSSYGGVRYFSKKGRVTKDKNGKNVVKFSTNKKGYITKATGARKYRNVIKYHENGFPSKITNKNSYFNIVTKFDENGIITYTKEPGYNRKHYTEREYVSSEADGKLELIESVRDDGKGEWKQVEKYVFSFGEKKTKDKRHYVAMMNIWIDYATLSEITPEHCFIYGNG